MYAGLNPAEQFVYRICRESFLSLWSYVNPRGKHGKELCDILVVCDPDVVIVSVKNIQLSVGADKAVSWQRWRKKAIEASVDQIYGAERWLDSATEVIRSDGSTGFLLPTKLQRRIHRIAVAFGSQGKSPIEFGNFGKGFVHVLDEISFSILLRELDTITDFVSYLQAKETLIGTGTQLKFSGSEEDLLAFYLHSGRSFPETHEVIMIGNDLWKTFEQRGEVEAKRAADRISYVWDRVIEKFAGDVLTSKLELAPSPSQTEIALRTMAREDRFARRVLGQAFEEFLRESSPKNIRARMLQSRSNVVYVFLASPHGEDRQRRTAELGLRCFVARGLHPSSKDVVGLATEQYEPGRGFSLDLVAIHKDEWETADQSYMEDVQRELGYFAHPVHTSTHADEYPPTESAKQS